jgi:hypothetical protein
MMQKERRVQVALSSSSVVAQHGWPRPLCADLSGEKRCWPAPHQDSSTLAARKTTRKGIGSSSALQRRKTRPPRSPSLGGGPRARSPGLPCPPPVLLCSTDTPLSRRSPHVTARQMHLRREEMYFYRSCLLGGKMPCTFALPVGEGICEAQC